MPEGPNRRLRVTVDSGRDAGDGGFPLGIRRCRAHVGLTARRRHWERGSLDDIEAMGRPGGWSRDGRGDDSPVVAAGAFQLLSGFTGRAYGDAAQNHFLHSSATWTFLRRGAGR